MNPKKNVWRKQKENQINILNFKTILRMQWINVLKTKCKCFILHLQSYKDGSAKG